MRTSAAEHELARRDLDHSAKGQTNRVGAMWRACGKHPSLPSIQPWRLDLALDAFAASPLMQIRVQVKHIDQPAVAELLQAIKYA
jgi:hypothetical protein